MVANAAQLCHTVVISLSKDMLKFKGVTIFEFAFFRSIINLAAASFVVKFREKTTFFDSVPTELWPTMMIRSLAGSFNFLVYNTAVVYIPIGIHKIIMNMSVFTVAILAWVWLGERLVCFEIIAIFVAFSGVVLTSKGKDPQDGAFQADKTADNYFVGISLAILGCMLAAVTAVSSRKLKPVVPNVIIFNYDLCSTIITGSILLGIWIYSESLPYRFESKWTYLEILIAALMNYAA